MSGLHLNFYKRIWVQGSAGDLVKVSIFLSALLMSTACAQNSATKINLGPEASQEAPISPETEEPASVPDASSAADSAETVVPQGAGQTSGPSSAPEKGSGQPIPPPAEKKSAAVMSPIPDEPGEEIKKKAENKKTETARTPSEAKAPEGKPQIQKDEIQKPDIKPAASQPASAKENSPKTPTGPAAEVIPAYVRFPISLLFQGAKLSDIKQGGFVHPTVYYKPIIKVQQKDCKPEELMAIGDRNGQTFLKVCPPVRKACLMQGSCLLLHEKEEIFLNYDRDGKFMRVRSQRCPYGLGLQNRCLDPYYTVAADQQFFNVGDVIFVPRVVNLLLPNNTRHNGFFIVRDGGGMIIGANRFDFFTGFVKYNTKSNPFTPVGLAEKRTRLEYYKVGGETAQIVRRGRGYPQIQEADRASALLDVDSIIEDILELENVPARDGAKLDQK